MKINMTMITNLIMKIFLNMKKRMILLERHIEGIIMIHLEEIIIHSEEIMTHLEKIIIIHLEEIIIHLEEIMTHLEEIIMIHSEERTMKIENQDVIKILFYNLVMKILYKNLEINLKIYQWMI